jgi:hypothetical protein
MVRAAVALRVESQIDISAARRRKGGVEDVEKPGRTCSFCAPWMVKFLKIVRSWFIWKGVRKS